MRTNKPKVSFRWYVGGLFWGAAITVLFLVIVFNISPVVCKFVQTRDFGVFQIKWTLLIDIVLTWAFGIFAYISALVAAAPQIKFSIIEEKVKTFKNKKGIIVTDVPYLVDISPSLPSSLNIQVFLNYDQKRVSEELYKNTEHSKRERGINFQGHFYIKEELHTDDILKVVIGSSNVFVESKGFNYYWKYNGKDFVYYPFGL